MLANALEYQCTLEELYIASNRIGDDGAAAIADILSVSENLLTLDIFPFTVIQVYIGELQEWVCSSASPPVGRCYGMCIANSYNS